MKAHFSKDTILVQDTFVMIQATANYTDQNGKSTNENPRATTSAV